MEDVEELLTPAEPIRTMEGTNLDDLMRTIMEGNNRTTEMFQQMKDNFKKQDEKLDSTCLLYTSRCV